jgi:hypothetical protein
VKGPFAVYPSCEVHFGEAPSFWLGAVQQHHRLSDDTISTSVRIQEVTLRGASGGGHASMAERPITPPIASADPFPARRSVCQTMGLSSRALLMRAGWARSRVTGGCIDGGKLLLQGGSPRRSLRRRGRCCQFSQLR